MTSFPDEDTLFRVITCLANEGYNVNNVLQTNKAFWWDEQIWDAMKNKCGSEGMTPLMYNAWKGNTERVAWLLKRTPKLETNAQISWDSMTALGLASKNGHLEVVRLLCNAGADVNESGFIDDDHYYFAPALVWAAKEGHLEIVKELCDRGADVNYKDDDYETALMQASGEGHLEVFHELCRRGADVNAKNSFGRTSLMMASRRGHLEIVKELCDRGADVNAAQFTYPCDVESGMTALVWAAKKGHLEIERLLIEKGADKYPGHRWYASRY